MTNDNRSGSEGADSSDCYCRLFPDVIRIEPSASCNLQCLHCPTGTVPMRRGIMAPGVFDAVLATVRAHSRHFRVAVLYHGGEPMLNERFVVMLRALKDEGIPYVKTTTNGMFLDETAQDSVIDAGLDLLEVSLDGVSAAQNDTIRKRSVADTILANIRSLARRKAERGAAHPEIAISTQQFLHEGQAPPVNGDAPPPEWLRDAVGDIASFKSTYAMRWPHISLDEELFGFITAESEQEEEKHCSYVDETITVRWNGDVVACCFDLTSQLVMGNILEDSLESIWNGPAYLKLRKSLVERRFNSVCANCNVVRKSVYLTVKKG